MKKVYAMMARLPNSFNYGAIVKLSDTASEEDVQKALKEWLLSVADISYKFLYDEEDEDCDV